MSRVIITYHTTILDLCVSLEVVWCISFQMSRNGVYGEERQAKRNHLLCEDIDIIVV